MQFVVLGWPPDGPQLRLDHRQFAYAGKFVMSTTGKAVAREDDATIPEGVEEYATGVLAAAAFSEDRTDDGTLWIRYLTTRRDRQGEGIGSLLAAFVAGRADERGYDRVRIGVNNPFSYQALYRAGFGFTGEETGLAELVLERPGDRSRATYRAGLDHFRNAGRDLSDEERAFLHEKRDAAPPEVVDPPE